MKIGVLGGGQLGRMLALAGYPLGMHFRFLDSHPEAPAEPLAEFLDGDFADRTVLRDFARDLDLATYEFENVPVAAANTIAEICPVYPPPRALELSQDRLVEKSLFRDLGIPTPRFASVERESDLARAIDQVGLPAVLKTRRLGYDGKGQTTLWSHDDADQAWSRTQEKPSILEELILFDRELSILAVRGRDRRTAFYPLVENVHSGGILRWSVAPAAGVEPELTNQAHDYAERILDRADYVGVLAIEFFARNRALLANEMAPRVHNSGHWTIEGAVTSQFENHLRAVAGLPLGGTDSRGRFAMFNLIGSMPARAFLLSLTGLHLHVYGKTERPGRKLGHVTVPLDQPDVGRTLDTLVTILGLEKEWASWRGREGLFA